MRLLLAAAAFSLAGAVAYYGLLLFPPSVEPMGGEVRYTATEIVAVETATPVTEAPDPAPEPPVRSDVQEKTYNVSGRTAEEILQSLMRAGPREGREVFFGLTTAQMDLRYSMVRFGRACELRETHVVLDMTVTLPEWKAPPETEPTLRRDWRRFLNALRRHEEEHVRIAERGADALYRAVEGLRRTTCEAAEADGRRRVNRLQIEIEAAHRRFDERTEHGRTQGAFWPLDRGRG